MTALPATLRIEAEQQFSSGFVVAPKLEAALDPGAVLVLFGPSGGGKTTILRQIAGLDRPQRATISWAGETWCDSAAGIWRTPQERLAGIVFQQPALFPHFTVRENIEYGLATRPRQDRRCRGDELLDLLGIADLAGRLPHALSGGQAQRVALARALAPEPKLMLLDEPFASLDAPGRNRLRRDTRALLGRIGTPAVLVTHDRAEALAVGDMMAVVIGGRIRQIGAVTDVFSRPADAEVAASLGVEAVLPARIVDSVDGLASVAIGSALLHVADRDGGAVGSDVYACIRAEDVTIELESPSHASTRNHLAGRVVSITPEGAVDRVSLDCGFAIDALITRRAREELRLVPGMAVTAAIKATSVHLVAR